jgi:hypothetical protein
MKVIGFSAGVVGRDSNVDRMVKAILAACGHSAEFVKLTDLHYSGCKGCAQLCAKPQVCMLEDDLLPYYQKIKEADAVIVGSPVYSRYMNANTLAFLERFFGYSHQARIMQNKPFVFALSGCWTPDIAAQSIRKRLRTPIIDILDIVTYRSLQPSCVACGQHEHCVIGGLYLIFGKVAHSLETTTELIHHWEDDADTVGAINAAVAKLNNRLALNNS